MHRVAKRAWSLLVAVAVLLGGLSFFLYEYAQYAKDWVFHSGSTHIYVGADQLAIGSVVDRDGNFLLNLHQQRTYSPDASLRESMVHGLGDRAGNI